MRLLTKLASVAIDGALTVAMAVDGAIDRWKNRKPKGLSFKDVERINRIARSAGPTAKTVIIPRQRQPYDQ